MNSVGRLFRISIYGESHGSEVGVILDGVKPGIPLNKEMFKDDLNRRKAGRIGTTKRLEKDEIIIKSGVFNGFTTGAPILLTFSNENINSKDYLHLINQPRPSHADFTAHVKYHGFQDYRGGGHFSGRLTTGLVAAGVVAKKMLPCTFLSRIIQLGNLTDLTKMDEYLEKIRLSGDSVGGIVEVTVKNMIKGLGEPYFDSLESTISHLLFSIGGVKGVEFGIGFKGTTLKGSEFNDSFIDENGTTKTNNNGGINGGISNGNDLIIKVFVKPTPSIFQKQPTYSFEEKKVIEQKITGRHDVAIILRAMVVIENAIACALADSYLIFKAYN